MENFEEALKRLEEIAKRLENEEIMLDEAIKLYEEGMKLVDFCSKKLQEAENRIKIITGIKNGQLETEDFTDEA
ncbi:exodeoxyribonuclease VII small subunit [Hippea alviniae]|uniref:exodeoxyribonuclease VII small subunit n=1 Tax=Hippea alviniae TaxID=1279027 RepID=UPI0003B3F074|nr:exodeoxyribonuclease VII small subunit [Hippea alviniae]